MGYLTPDTIPAVTRCRTLVIPDDIYILAAVNGALYDLTLAENWEQYGAVTPQQISAAMMTLLTNYFQSECIMDSFGNTQVRWLHGESSVADGAALAWGDVANHPYGGIWFQNPGALNDQWQTLPLLLHSGTWRTDILFNKNNNRGFLTLELWRSGDSNRLDYFVTDMYAAAQTPNQRANYSWVCPTDTYYWLVGKVAGKNINSIGYYASLTEILMSRTGD